MASPVRLARGQAGKVQGDSGSGSLAATLPPPAALRFLVEATAGGDAVRREPQCLAAAGATTADNKSGSVATITAKRGDCFI